MLKGVALVVVAGILGAGYASAAPTAPPLKVSALVLAPSDFPAGATVVSEVPRPSPYMPPVTHTSAITRSISGARIGKIRFIELQSSAVVATNAARAGVTVAAFVSYAASKSGRAALISEIEHAAGGSAASEFASVKLLRDRPLRTGDEGLDIDFQLTTHSGIKVVVEELYVQKGAAVTFTLFASGSPGLDAGQSTELAKTLLAHIDTASAPPPVSKTAPTISGTLQPGEVLTAKPGSWTGSGLAYSYQWLKCNGAGSACTPVAGATASTYTVTTDEVGSTLAVLVSAANAAGSASMTSASTSPIQTA